MAIGYSQVDRTARAAVGAVHVEPWHAGDQRRPDCWRPQDLSAGGELLIPAIDDGDDFGAHGAKRPLRAGRRDRQRPALSSRMYRPSHIGAASRAVSAAISIAFSVATSSGRESAVRGTPTT